MFSALLWPILAECEYIPAVAASSKPLITANMVTTVRLMAMPLLAWLIYQDPASSGSTTSWWYATVVGTLVGCTDFVDGYLARKYGPTVLGGMLDPLADKIFVALIYLPMMHLGFVAQWAVGLLFVREFLVTSIRSAYEWRGLQLKTSYFGKVKTWIQMQGIAVLVLGALLSRQVFLTGLVIGTILPMIAVAVYWVTKKSLSRNNVLGSLLMFATFLLFWVPDNLSTSIDIAIWAICLVTWLSGLDYLLGAIPALQKAGGFHRADLVRVLGAVLIPMSAVVALMHSTASAVPVLLVIASELAAGGLDNLLSRHRATSRWTSYAARVLGASALLFLTALLDDQTELLAWVAMALSLSGVAMEFWRGRTHYLDNSKWDEELVDA